MDISISEVWDSDSISATFRVMQQLRPHLESEDYEAQLQALMDSERLHLVAAGTSDRVVAVATFRLTTMLYCEKILSIDDIVVDHDFRSKGIGSKLIAWLLDRGRAAGCSEVQLISRVTREEAHRFYFREGFGIECFHFRTKLL